MSTIAQPTRIPLLSRWSATGRDDARAMKLPTPHAPPRSWLPRTAIGAATSPFALIDIRHRQRPRSHLITAATKSP